jgi:hypothetical protein
MNGGANPDGLLKRNVFEYTNNFLSNQNEFKRLIDDDLARAQSEMQVALTDAKSLIARMSTWLKENESRVKTFLESKQHEMTVLSSP